MGAGVGHGAAPQVFDEIFQFPAAKGIVGFHGVTADGFGHGVFAETGEVDLATGGAEFIHEVEHKAAGVGHFDEGREGVQQEGPFAKLAQADAETGERAELFAQELGVARREFDGLGQQQFLRGGGGIGFNAGHHLLEQNPFVGGMLIQQHQAAIRFEQHIQPADHADEPQRDVEQGRRAGRQNSRFR